VCGSEIPNGPRANATRRPGDRKKKGDKRKKQMDEAKDYNEGKEVVSVLLLGTQNGSFFERMPVKKDAVMLVPADYREEDVAPSLRVRCLVPCHSPPSTSVLRQPQRLGMRDDVRKTRTQMIRRGMSPLDSLPRGVG
jgi:hypothetical protein